MKRRNVEIQVSDHAVLRWLEREHDLDVDAVRRTMSGMVTNAAELAAISARIGQVRMVLRELGQSPEGRPVVMVTTALPKGVVFRPERRGGNGQ